MQEKFLSMSLLSIHEEYESKDSFLYQDSKEDCYAWEYYEDIPRGYVSCGSGYYVYSFKNIQGDKVLTISFYSFVMIQDPKPAGCYLASDMFIEIKSNKNFDLEQDIYKYLTDCNKIQNMKIALSQVNPNIYINILSNNFENFTKYRESNKLKIRKSKKCISVIKQRTKIKSKRNPYQEILPLEARHRKYQVSIIITNGLYDSLLQGGQVTETGESYSTTSMLQTELTIKSPNLLQYNIKALSEAYKTNEVKIDTDGTAWCPYSISIPRNYRNIYNQNFDYTFNIHLVTERSKINRKKSKRSKIICIRQ
jgi:hypothetical protein